MSDEDVIKAVNARDDAHKRRLMTDMFDHICDMWGEDPDEVTSISFRATGRPVFTKKIKEAYRWGTAL